MNTAADRIVRRYDEVVKATGKDGIKVAEARDKVAAEVLANRLGYDLPTDDLLIEAYVASVVGGERNSRAKRRVSIFQTCHDAAAGATILAKDDPMLDVAMRTGASDGLDKAMRYFTVEDWLDVLGASASNVAAAIEADRDLRMLVNPIVAAYVPAGATCFEDLL